MLCRFFRVAALAVIMTWVADVSADVQVIVDQHPIHQSTPEFSFQHVPPPSQNDSASKATFTLVTGRRDANGGTVDKLHDGHMPDDGDQPRENFFFGAGSEGGRLLIDLQSEIAVRQVNTYSWHPDSRGPQVYVLYGSRGTAEKFSPRPEQGTDPLACGWTAITSVDTRPADGPSGGQYGVSISASDGQLGTFRYLLFDIARTETDDPFGNTFFSEIDVVDDHTPPQAATPIPRTGQKTFLTEDGKYRMIVDTSETPDLTEWVHGQLMPVLLTWYPKIVRLLPSDGYEAPVSFRIYFSRDMQGVAATGGTTVSCAANWFRANLQGEATGAVVHELVHVVQQYSRVRRTSGNRQRTPGWIVEGIADYVRWYLYEPESNGAVISPSRAARVQYDNSYRVSANFLDWVGREHDPQIVVRLNTAARTGNYNDQIWIENTGHSVDELGRLWKESLQQSEP